MKFRVLGPLEARANGVAVPFGTRKLVSVEELVDELWVHDLLSSAIANVRSHAGKLRRACAPDDDGNARIIRRNTGYALCAAPSGLDLLAVMAEGAAGRAAGRAGQHPEG